MAKPEIERSFVVLEIEGSGEDACLTYQLALVLQEYLTLFKGKQRMYGYKNISRMGKYGIALRLCDKAERLRHMFLEGDSKEGDEPEKDAWLDTLGLGAIGEMVRRGVWPDLPGDRVARQDVWFVFKAWLKGILNAKKP